MLSDVVLILFLFLTGTILLAGFLCLKIYLLKKGMRELTDNLSEILQEDTNQLLTTASRDHELRGLTDRLNVSIGQLRRARLKYQSGDREIKEAVTNVSHDLRTPLTAVSGYLELIERDPSSPKAREYLGIVKSRVSNMKKLTEELLGYSIALSVPGETSAPLSLNRALEESLLEFYAALGQRNIFPKVSMPETPVLRTLDSAHVSRVFSNIISNALRYSDGDLEVTLTEQGSVTFSNTAKNLTPVTTARLFDRFYTVETAQCSTGLGLSIARLLTERMGGRISAEYREGKLYITVQFP